MWTSASARRTGEWGTAYPGGGGPWLRLAARAAGPRYSREFVNASRPGGRARYAPLHQAAHGGAPVSVVRHLLQMGAWRTLRTRRGERAVDIAGRRRHLPLIPLLLVVYNRSRIARDVRDRVQGHFRALIRTYPAGRKPFLRLPELELLLALGRESVYCASPLATAVV